ncbi:salicylate hydroxylase [Micromonospora pisi]|uniref:Salicylate hydroxylase n=1 Tax=Micromonospora pisi TaxID=589240 RepID=A0A495JP28_9ACTN|nr:FAD-dependent monooxygenase [Micromonospora pisi]RKR90385.1 salicylate hydroxylase [Micromonospora pisi]
MGTDEMRIAVVGAGIAGLTVAAALLRAGIRCEVFEQTRQLRELGAGIQLSPNAVRPLRELGLGENLEAVAVRPAAIEMRRWDSDALIGRTNLGDECEQMYGAPYYCVHRADLHQGLLELLPAGTVRLGLRCVGVRELPDGVELRFADGTSTTVDAVVGADGIHSVVRQELIDDQPRFSGHTVYRGVAPAQRLPHLAREPKVLIWLGPGQHCVSYPIAGGSLVSFVATSPAGEWRDESWTAQGRVEDLVAGYTGWHDNVWGLLTAADSVTRWALHDRDTVERWSSGRITIVGDAAHPMLPFGAQGANQAIEDAVALAACLSTGIRDIPAALAHYERVRRPRIDVVHRTIRENARNHHFADGEQQRDRDRNMRESWSLDSSRWLFGYDAALAVRQ